MNVNKYIEKESLSLFLAPSKKPVPKWVFWFAFGWRQRFPHTGFRLLLAGSWGRVAWSDKGDTIIRLLCWVWCVWSGGRSQFTVPRSTRQSQSTFWDCWLRETISKSMVCGGLERPDGKQAYPSWRVLSSVLELNHLPSLALISRVACVLHPRKWLRAEAGVHTLTSAPCDAFRALIPSSAERACCRAILGALQSPRCSAHIDKTPLKDVAHNGRRFEFRATAVWSRGVKVFFVLILSNSCNCYVIANSMYLFICVPLQFFTAKFFLLYKAEL